MSKVYVGNIPESFDGDDLAKALESAGKIVSARVQGPGQEPNKNKGYGFVEFSSAAEANVAIATLDGALIQGRTIKVNVAGQPRPARTDARKPIPKVAPKAVASTSKGKATSSNQDASTAPQEIYSVGEPLVDIGANLTHGKLRDLTTVLDRATQAGLSHIVITGTSVEASEAASKLASSPNKSTVKLYSTAGVHPHDATKTLGMPNWEGRLTAAITSHPSHVVAVGECGLDYDRMFSAKEDQVKVFRAQMALARKMKLPVFLHCRSTRNTDDAHADFVAILRDFSDVKACVHCMTDDSPRRLQELLDLDCYIGITGWVADHRRGKGLAEVVYRIPLDRLMIETDAPFLVPLNMPKAYPGKTNEPAYLGWVVKKLAECMELSEVEVARGTTATAKEFFGLQ